jgi:nucleoside-diphosphate-sugar epimerase
MKVFVAGATGALGLPLVRELVARGHEVTAMTRSKDKVAMLEQMSAKAVVADALDVQSLQRAVSQASPTHIVDLLTAFPDGGPLKPKDMVATNRLRTEGTANLLYAAYAAGVQRIVAESYFAVYGYGDHGDKPLAEDAPLPAQASDKGLQESVDAMRSLETQLLDADRKGKVEVVILRFGSIYGPDSPGTQAIFEMLRKRKMPLIKGADGLTPFLHTSDAARAIVAALEHGQHGKVYNIADDTRASFNEFIATAAEAVGAPRPSSYPRWLVRFMAPAAVATASSRIPLSNNLAKRELGWTPQFPDFHAGVEQVARQLTEPRAVEGRAVQQVS